MTHIPLPPVLGITGSAGSGKTTVGNWFLRNHTQSIRMSFASPIKVMIRKMLEDALPKTWHIKPAEYINNAELKETTISFLGGNTPRHLMQTLGTEWGRNTVHPDLWVWIAAGKLERLLGSGFKNTDNLPLKALFDDLRFQNEADMIHAYDGIILRVERPGFEKPAEVAAHASEQMTFPADVTLINDGTEQDLFDKLAAMWPPTPGKKA
jgi:hypothetical protein